MLINSLKSRRDDEEGFTLIELMVVVLIIAILIAIAIPTFLGARERAQNRAAQSNLRNALTAEKTFFTDDETFTADMAAAGDLDSIEPSLDWGAAADQVAVVIGDADGVADSLVCIQTDSKSGSTFAIADIAVGPNAGTYYATDTACSQRGSHDRRLGHGLVDRLVTANLETEQATVPGFGPGPFAHTWKALESHRIALGPGRKSQRAWRIIIALFLARNVTDRPA